MAGFVFFAWRPRPLVAVVGMPLSSLGFETGNEVLAVVAFQLNEAVFLLALDPLVARFLVARFLPAFALVAA